MMTITERKPPRTTDQTQRLFAQLAAQGIVIGLPRSVAIEQHIAMPLFEIELRREDIPNEQGLRTVTEHTRAQILWRITIDELHMAKTFEEADWQLFVSLVAMHSERHTLVLAYDRSIEYDPARLDALESFRDVASMPIYLDAEHASWKTQRVQSVMKSLKLPHVFIDGPKLPGIVKDISYVTGKTAILRCLGRNSRSWFEHGHARYAYEYTAEEILQIAERVKQLRDAAGSVFVVMHNRPAAAATKNAAELAQALLKMQ